MQQTKTALSKKMKTIKLLPLAAALLLSTTGFAQKQDSENRADVNYKQRHSALLGAKDIYADGIKIKRDLSILKEVQEERILSADEIPAEQLYGEAWSNRYVNAYRSLESVPDTFKVDLSNFSIPTTGHVTSNFGPRRRRMHYGIDLKVQTGDTIYAAFDGKVRVKQYEKRGYGYYLVLRHSNGLETVYGHLSGFLVDEEQVIKSGQPIGLGGNTGRSFGSHLHFEFRYVGRPINPTAIVDFDNKVCHRDSYLITPKTFAYDTKAQRFGKGTGASDTYVATPTRTSDKVTNKYASGKVNHHRIQKGDTLSTIAKKYGTTISKLCSLNSMTAKSTLRAGKSLRVS